MSLTPAEVGRKRHGRPPRLATLVIACLMASSASTIVTAATAQASVAPVVTRAAIAPSLTAGRGAEVQKIAEQLLKIDPSSPFSERTFMLRPPTAAAAAAPGGLTVPSIALPSKP